MTKRSIQEDCETRIEDYEKTAAPVDYTPRARASQIIAAAKRAAHYDEGPMTPLAYRPRPRQQVIAMVVIGILLVSVLALALGGTHAPTKLAITSAPTVAAPTQAAQPTAQPTVAPVVTIPAYAAPDGAVLGEIAADRPLVPVAHYGSGWVAYQDGDGLVWVRTGDRPDLALTGPDLAPPQTGRGLTLVQDSAPPDAPTPTDAPAEPTATVVWATSTTARPHDFAAPSTSATCKLVGCLGNNAVAAAHEQACHALYWQYGDSEDIPADDAAAVRQCIWEGLYK